MGKVAGDTPEIAKQQLWIHLGNGYDDVITQLKKRHAPRTSQSDKMKGNQLRMRCFTIVLDEIEKERTETEKESLAINQ